MKLTDYQEIRALLSLHGFHFTKSLGQNFLTAAWVPDKIAEAAAPNRSTGVLEIGPGIGCLTVPLSRLAGRVVSVELDRRLMPVFSQTLAGCENVEVVFGDALKMDLQALVEEEFLSRGLQPVVCANLPYNITSPILTKLTEMKCFANITVMIQQEVARRICASAGESDYSAFGILMQWRTVPELLFDVSPSCFVPQPKVTSTVIRLGLRETPPAEVQDEKLFFTVVRAAFNQRRKTLVNALSSQIPGVSRETVAKALETLGLDGQIRGEALAVKDFAQLSNLLSKQ